MTASFRNDGDKDRIDCRANTAKMQHRIEAPFGTAFNGARRRQWWTSSRRPLLAHQQPPADGEADAVRQIGGEPCPFHRLRLVMAHQARNRAVVGQRDCALDVDLEALGHLVDCDPPRHAAADRILEQGLAEAAVFRLDLGRHAAEMVADSGDSWVPPERKNRPPEQTLRVTSAMAAGGLRRLGAWTTWPRCGSLGEKPGGDDVSQSEDGLRSPEYWEERAKEARTRASEMRDSASRDLMLRIASTYDAMADRARAARALSN